MFSFDFSVGGVLVVVCGAQAIWWRGGGARAMATVGICILLVCGAARTVHRNRDWLSRESLLRYNTKFYILKYILKNKHFSITLQNNA